jgi:hypothetical protein
LGGQLHFRGSCRTGYLEHMLDESGLSCCHSPHRHCLSTFVAVTKFRGNVVPTYRISTIVFLHLEKCGFGVCSHVRRVWTSFDRPKLELVARLSSACQLLIYREAMSSHKTRTEQSMSNRFGANRVCCPAPRCRVGATATPCLSDRTAMGWQELLEYLTIQLYMASQRRSTQPGREGRRCGRRA